MHELKNEISELDLDHISSNAVSQSFEVILSTINKLQRLKIKINDKEQKIKGMTVKKVAAEIKEKNRNSNT